MSNKSTPIKKVTNKKNLTQENEPIQSTKADNWLDEIDLEEISPNELIALIENENEYQLVFSRLNELFLEYGNAMSEIDLKRQHDIDLMKAVHSVWKSKPPSIQHIEYHEDDDSNDVYDSEENDDSEEEEKEEEEEEKIIIKKVVKKAATKTVKQSQDEDKCEVQEVVEQKPTRKVATKKVATKKAVPVKAVPVKTVKKAATKKTSK